MARPRKPPPPCPECGAPLSLEGKFCRKCGYDASLVHSRDSYLDGVDLPQGYAEDDAAEDADPGTGWPPRGRRLFYAVVALVALVAFLLTMFPW